MDSSGEITVRPNEENSPEVIQGESSKNPIEGGNNHPSGNAVEVIPGRSFNDSIGGESSNCPAPIKIVQGRSVNNSISEESSHFRRDERYTDERNNYDFGVPNNHNYFNYNPSVHNSLRTHYDVVNPAFHGGRSSQSYWYEHGRNDYDSRFPPNANERHFLSYGPTLYGGPGHCGRSTYDFGHPPNRYFQSYYNPIVQGGPSNNGRNNYEFGYPPNHNDFRHPLDNLPVYGVGGRSNQYDGRSNELEVPYGNQEVNGVGNSSHENANQKQDAESKMERAKLKNRVIDLYKLKVPITFSKNSHNFEKDDWLKVWYVGSEGLKLYQSHLNCPLCYKKITPQNRAGAGSVPRWELTNIKGHLDRLHSEAKVVEKENAAGEKVAIDEKGDNDGMENEERTDKKGEKEANNEGAAGEKVSIDEKGDNSGMENEEKTDKKGEKEADNEEDVEDDSNASELYSPHILSSPESNSSGPISPLERSQSSDPQSDSTGPEKTVARKRKFTHKSGAKRVAGDAGTMKRKRDESSEWKQRGVEFGWVKFTTGSRFLPAFIFPLEKGKKKKEARQILTKGGELENKKHEVDSIATPLQVEQTKKLPKTKPYLAALKMFNARHQTNFS